MNKLELRSKVAANKNILVIRYSNNKYQISSEKELLVRQRGGIANFKTLASAENYLVSCSCKKFTVMIKDLDDESIKRSRAK